jgi:hypothetical protein
VNLVCNVLLHGEVDYCVGSMDAVIGVGNNGVV